jgi:predicted HAD superfamily Cof-like phosphohydrolase
MEIGMSNDWVKDINDMHTKFKVHDWVKNNPEKLTEYLNFRLKFLQEELEETRKAVLLDKNPEEIVDGLIDLCVVAIGTLDAFRVNAHEAWNAVHESNMTKEVGIKKERPNPLGLPDLIKPVGWRAPSHKNNLGIFKDIEL